MEPASRHPRHAILPGIVEGERIRRVFDARPALISFAEMEQEALSLVRCERSRCRNSRRRDPVHLSPRGRTISVRRSVRHTQMLIDAVARQKVDAVEGQFRP